MLFVFVFIFIFIVDTYDCEAAVGIRNGGCDSLTNCTDVTSNNAAICSACPIGYFGTGADGCYKLFADCSSNVTSELQTIANCTVSLSQGNQQNKTKQNKTKQNKTK